MTANELLNKYFDALKMSDSGPIDLQNVILDILKYLSEKEDDKNADLLSQYQNGKLWVEIEKLSDWESDTGIPKIELPKLRHILEKYKILGDEKDGM